MQIEKAPNELGDVTKIVPAQVLKVFLVLATCTKIQQEGDKLQETLPNEREQRLADLQASQKFQWTNNDKSKYLSTKDQIKGTAKEMFPK